jgi:uncharacterized protein YraI
MSIELSTPSLSSLSSSTRDLLAGERTISRRTFSRGLLALGAAAVVGQAIGPASASAQVGSARATSDLNLRSGPGTTYRVLRVIPNGGQVTLNGRVQNGFQDVTYNGTAGWAHGDYLKPLGGSPGPSPSPSPSPVGWGHTTTAVNFRSGPSTGHQVFRVLPSGAPVQLQGQRQNGFVYAIHEGLAGWLHGDYVVVDGGSEPEPPSGTQRALSDQNLRAEPSLKGKVLLVIPEYGNVTVVGGYANNYLKVSYQGTVGWAYLAYLG